MARHLLSAGLCVLGFAFCGLTGLAGQAPAPTPALAREQQQPGVSPSPFLDFGPDFVFGLVMDAYQFEGSTTAGGRGPSNLDSWCHWDLTQPGGWKLCGDVGAGFYEHMRDDVELMARMGQKHLHFQFAWTRIFPDGGSEVNAAGVAFYDALVDVLVAHGITPWASIEVFDFPSTYQQQWAGWLGAPMVDEYERLAKFLIGHFGDRVKHWFSFHEPDTLCDSYGSPVRFIGPRPNPALNDTSVLDRGRDHYRCLHNMLLAHARAAAALRASPHGDGAELSIIVGAGGALANDTSSAADAAAVRRFMLWEIGAWIDPIQFGDYPAEMRAAAGDRLPTFSAAESAALRNTTAVVGLNHYTSDVVAAAACPPWRHNHSYEFPTDAFYADRCLASFKDARTGTHPDPHLTWLTWHPPGVAQVLRWVSDRYGLPIMLTETGLALDGGSNGDPTSSGNVTLDCADEAKVDLLKQYWAVAHAVMNTSHQEPSQQLDGTARGVASGGTVNLRGLFHWSWLDNLEWGSGYAAHFGMVHVDHTRPDLRRTPKASARWYQTVVQKHGFNVTAGGRQECIHWDRWYWRQCKEGRARMLP